MYSFNYFEKEAKIKICHAEERSIFFNLHTKMHGAEHPSLRSG
jgi:hypothetical protein